MEATTKAKPKRQMTPEQLEKLKLAREKALQKKREIKEIKDGEKAINTLHYITYSTQQGVGTPLGANERN
jgi:hypothetical protein